MKAFGLECWAEKGGLALAQQDNNMSTTEIKKKKMGNLLRNLFFIERFRDLTTIGTDTEIEEKTPASWLYKSTCKN